MLLKPLSELPAFDKKSKSLHAVIETPKRSPNKYDYDPELGCFTLSKTLPEGKCFPFGFGFVPSTLGDDGDPLDILVLKNFAVLRHAGGLRVSRALCIEAPMSRNAGPRTRRGRPIRAPEASSCRSPCGSALLQSDRRSRSISSANLPCATVQLSWTRPSGRESAPYFAACYAEVQLAPRDSAPSGLGSRSIRHGLGRKTAFGTKRASKAGFAEQ